MFETALKRWSILWNVASPWRAEPALRASTADARRFSLDTAAPSAWSVDDQTWRDLDLDRLAGFAAQDLSLLAQHCVYRSLLVGHEPQEASDTALPVLVAATMTNPEQARSLAKAFERLSALKFDPTTSIFCDELPALPDWTKYLWMFPIALTLISTLAIMVPALIGAASVAAIVALVLSGYVQIKLHNKLLHWKLCRDAIVAVLRASIEVDEVPRSVAADARQRMALAKEIIREIRPHWLARFPPAAEPMNMFLLSEYASMPGKVQRLRRRLAPVRETYFRLAQLEAATGIARLMEHAGKCCQPEHATSPRELELWAFTNPVIPNISPIPSLALKGKGAFITGQNGVGKSTILRSVGVNLIAARAFGHCFAERASVPRGQVTTSIQIEDSPLHGQSLYVAELQRARELLAAARASADGIILIDEIFAGTNHLDAVSVAATVLDELSRNAGVIVSSHNVVLAPLLRDVMTPLRVVRTASGGVLIEAGVLADTNGIELIKQFGFTDDHVSRARAVFRWLSEFMMEPPTEQTLEAIVNARPH